MFGKVTIGGKDIEMLANGVTPVFYNQIFHKDFFTESQGMGEDNAGLTIDVFMRLAFVMAKQAECADKQSKMLKVNEDQFISWLADFEPMDLPNAMPEVVDFYMVNTEGTAKPKK